MDFNKFLEDNKINANDMSSEQWNQIYSIGGWEDKGSGSGSIFKNNLFLIDFLNNIIQGNNYKSILDLGCGDLQYITSLDKFDELDYTGVDCSSYIIENNLKHDLLSKQIDNLNIKEIDKNSFLLNVLKNYKSFNNKTFVNKDIMDFEQDKPYDIVLCKDVFQHVQGNKEKLKLFLEKIKSFKSKITILITDRLCSYGHKDLLSDFLNIYVYPCSYGIKNVLIKF